MNPTVGTFAVLALLLVLGFVWYERVRPPARTVALVATLAALAALGRVAFAPLPNVKPTTDIVVIAGYVLGGAPGFAVGSISALSSNIFFGQGPWTPWQMFAWGCCGLAGAAFGRISGHRNPVLWLAPLCLISGLFYGLVLNFSTWITFAGDQSMDRFLAIVAAALPFDLAHAVGNVVFFLVFGPTLVRALERFRRRERAVWRWQEGAEDGSSARPPDGSAVTVIARGAALPLLLALTVSLGGLMISSSSAEAATKGSVDYLQRAQNSDGGFGGSPGGSSNQLHTGWTTLGLAAAGRNPLDVTKNGRSPIDYMRAGVGQLNDTGELERTILVLRAAGLSPRNFAGHNLITELMSKRRKDGSFSGYVSFTSFGILALRAAGLKPTSRPIRTAAKWLKGQVSRDGGFNFAGGGPSGDIDNTAAVIQALVASGHGSSRTVARAVKFLKRAQNRDGGFPLTKSGTSNAQSTAWAAQGFVAAGIDPETVKRKGRSPLAYLEGLRASDGSFRYSPVSKQTPVWVTGQALTALSRKPFPIGQVPRSSRSGGRSATTGRREVVAVASRVVPPQAREGGFVNNKTSKRPERSTTADKLRSSRPSSSKTGLSKGSGLMTKSTRRLNVLAKQAGTIAGLVCPPLG